MGWPFRWNWFAVSILTAIIVGACSLGPTPAPTEPPTPSASAEKSPTPAPSATSRPTAIPSPTPVPIHSGLSGLVVDSVDKLNRRPLIVKIDNVPAARPQSGLAEAEIVYETETEASITRFAAVYLGAEPEVVGPVRSARLSDLDLPYQFDGILVHVGGSQAELALLREQEFADLDQFWYPEVFYRSGDRAAPSNVYTSVKAMRDFANKQGWTKRREIDSYQFYWGDPTPEPGTKPAAQIAFAYASWSRSDYTYDPKLGGYRRESDGAAHLDARTGEQLLVRNVVAQFVETWYSDIVADFNGAKTLDFELVGRGDAIVFRDGLAIPATWVRPTKNDLTQYLDLEGKPIKFKPGNIWIHPVDREFKVDYS